VTGPGDFIPLHEPEFAGNEWKYVKDCIDTGWVSSVGAYVDRFEAMLAEQCGSRHAVATMNGTAALHIALLLVGVERGDEVLVPSLTFIATTNAVSYTGATPHFVDSSFETLGLDPVALDAYLTGIADVVGERCVNRATGATIRAVVPVHIFGHPVDMPALAPVAAKWKLRVVEDAAEGLGAWRGERHCGTFGEVGTLSFNGNKTITTGGGGAIITDDPALGARAKHLTTTARTKHRWSFEHDEIGYNYRLPNLNAALGCAQLERLDDLILRKRQLARNYLEAFAGLDGVSIVREPEGTRSNYWLVAMLLDEADAEYRDALLTGLNDSGLMARPVWTLMHRLAPYRDCPRGPLPVAESIEARLINVPSSPGLSRSQ
jgi:perosamine synthetase